MNSRFAAFRRSALLRAACAALVVAPASATVHTLFAFMNGVEEVPATTSLGLGTVTLTLDDVALSVTVTGSYSGLLTNATASHIHGIAAIGVNGPVMVNILTTGGTSGTLSGGGSLSASEVTNMLNGLTYLNIHTTGTPAGELRGQILKPPTGSTMYCFGDGSLPTVCPCSLPDTVPSPAAAPGHGCANSFDLNGATLKAWGNTSPDTVKFISKIGKGTAAFAFLLKGNATDNNGVASSDGIRCTDGALIRFGSHFAGTNGAPLGTWTYPNTAQTLSVSAATLQAPASTSYYQLFYRNALVGFCNASGANLSAGVSIPWP
jgi:hypothetical protein